MATVLPFPDMTAAKAKVAEGPVSLADFHAYMPAHSYIYLPTLASWPAASVNARIPPVTLTDDNGAPVFNSKGKLVVLPASAWLDRKQPVEQMTWAPGQPLIVKDRLVLEGGWIDRPGVSCLNLYRPPRLELGDPNGAQLWLDHVKLVYPDDDTNTHVINWFAHRVQRPEIKINHALVLGGEQGIGKDTMLEPVKYAVGAWNFQEVSPQQVSGRFNGFLRAVVLRISEARDLGESNRFEFYDHMKAYIAAPPDTLRVDEKNLPEYSIINCCGVIITTNYKTDGIYLPADDRRHFVAWSELKKDDARVAGNYWNRIWAYYATGGMCDVAAYLMQRDISSFDPKAPPPKTPAFWAIVDANRAPEESELADVLDSLGRPRAVALGAIQDAARDDFAEWLKDRRNRRVIPHRLERCGYVPVRNPTPTDGLWVVGHRRQAVYAQNTLSLRDQIDAAQKVSSHGQF